MQMFKHMLLAVIYMLVGIGCVSHAETRQVDNQELVLSDAAWSRVVVGMDAFMERVEGLDEFAPGAALILTTPDGRTHIRTHGVLKAGTQRHAGDDSAFYIASMTKAYMGLLAARLDAEGVLKLDTTLADYWPDLVLPDGKNASDYTLNNLLSHSVPIESGEINRLEAYVRDIDPEEYPDLIKRFAVSRKDGFQYDNIGYTFYAAILEKHTGKNWRVWLDEAVFTPLKLDDTSGLVSSYDPSIVAWGHRRMGDVQEMWPRMDGWYLVPPKKDGMMQAAGGLMTTPRDMARWLQAHLAGSGSEKSGLTPAIFALAQSGKTKTEPDHNGFSCYGYAYGWNLCDYIFDGAEGSELPDFGELLQHGGGYAGFRSLMTVARDLGLGVGVMSNSDNVTYFLNEEITKHALELALGIEGAEARSEQRVAKFVERNVGHLDRRLKRLSEARAKSEWQGWSWAPNEDVLSEYAGAYVSNDAWHERLEYSVRDGVLTMQAHDMIYQLDPATPDLFGGQANAYDRLETFQFTRDEAGDITGLDWREDHYQRAQ